MLLLLMVLRVEIFSVGWKYYVLGAPVSLFPTLRSGATWVAWNLLWWECLFSHHGNRQTIQMTTPASHPQGSSLNILQSTAGHAPLYPSLPILVHVARVMWAPAPPPAVETCSKQWVTVTLGAPCVSRMEVSSWWPTPSSSSQTETAGGGS